MPSRLRRQTNVRRGYVKTIVTKMAQKLQSKAHRKRMETTNRLLPLGSLQRNCVQKKILGGFWIWWVRAGSSPRNWLNKSTLVSGKNWNLVLMIAPKNWRCGDCIMFSRRLVSAKWGIKKHWKSHGGRGVHYGQFGNFAAFAPRLDWGDLAGQGVGLISG